MVYELLKNIFSGLLYSLSSLLMIFLFKNYIFTFFRKNICGVYFLNPKDFTMADESIDEIGLIEINDFIRLRLRIKDKNKVIVISKYGNDFNFYRFYFIIFKKYFIEEFILFINKKYNINYMINFEGKNHLVVNMLLDEINKELINSK